MTAKAALLMYLLKGHPLSLVNCFKEIGLSNPGREIPRMVEEPFGVEVSRTPTVGKNRFGSPVNFTVYRLNKTQRNLPGMDKMREYIKSQIGELPPPKTDKQAKIIKKAEAAIKTDRQERLF